MWDWTGFFSEHCTGITSTQIIKVQHDGFSLEKESSSLPPGSRQRILVCPGFSRPSRSCHSDALIGSITLSFNRHVASLIHEVPGFSSVGNMFVNFLRKLVTDRPFVPALP